MMIIIRQRLIYYLECHGYTVLMLRPTLGHQKLSWGDVRRGEKLVHEEEEEDDSSGCLSESDSESDSSRDEDEVKGRIAAESDKRKKHVLFEEVLESYVDLGRF